MKTAIKLCEYDDILNPRHIYSLLCLTALKNKFYGTCSKAFVKVSSTGTAAVLLSYTLSIILKKHPYMCSVLLFDTNILCSTILYLQ